MFINLQQTLFGVGLQPLYRVLQLSKFNQVCSPLLSFLLRKWIMMRNSLDVLAKQLTSMKNGKVNRNTVMPEMSLHSTFVQEGENPRFSLLPATDGEWLIQCNEQFKCQTAFHNCIGHLHQCFNWGTLSSLSHWETEIASSIQSRWKKKTKPFHDTWYYTAFNFQVCFLVGGCAITEAVYLTQPFHGWEDPGWSTKSDYTGQLCLKKLNSSRVFLPLPRTVKIDICISSSFPQLNWLVSLHLFFHSTRSNSLMQGPCSENTAWFWGLWPILSYCLKAWLWNIYYGKAYFNLLPRGLAGGSGRFKPWWEIHCLPIFQKICALSEYWSFCWTLPGLKNAKLELTTYSILIWQLNSDTQRYWSVKTLSKTCWVWANVGSRALWSVSVRKCLEDHWIKDVWCSQKQH